MQEMRWLKTHVGTMKEAIDTANGFYWNLSIKKIDGWYYVFSGEKVVFRADTEESTHAFLYGLALAYSVLPEPFANRIKEEMKGWVD